MSGRRVARRNLITLGMELGAWWDERRRKREKRPPARGTGRHRQVSIREGFESVWGNLRRAWGLP